MVRRCSGDDAFGHFWESPPQAEAERCPPCSSAQRCPQLGLAARAQKGLFWLSLYFMTPLGADDSRVRGEGARDTAALSPLAGGIREIFTFQVGSSLEGNTRASCSFRGHG